MRNSAGGMLEALPEVIAPPFDARAFGTSDLPEDGQLIVDKSYDCVKVEQIEAARL